ncbi:TSN33-like protein [Mya arenaria]|uniref:Tetraspanin n=1 Tax=Mya arenaria TaxID=6604 RepID=A0ABY7DNW2_MYAAR|nr:tetraspanin-33-like [Mya arenaria]WAQ98385.1 TSN33-like protein [Mya arenaria]
MGFCPKGDTLVNPIVKYILLVGTFIHWICGAGMVALGIWAFTEKNRLFYQPNENVYDIIFDMSIILMAFGGIMFIITICGFIGALRENTCLLRIFYYSLAVIFLLEIAGGVLVFVFKGKAVDLLSDVLKDVYVKEYHDDEEAIMDYFQETFLCCGIDDYNDWNMNPYFNCTAKNPSPLRCAVPYSCCKDPDELQPGLNNILCGAETLNTTTTRLAKIYTGGCVPAVINFLNANMPIIGAIVIAIGLPQLLGICLGRMFVGQIEGQWDHYSRERQRSARIKAAQGRGGGGQHDRTRY